MPKPAVGVGAHAIAAGLRDLRAKGHLCDAVLVAGGERFAAHQAVLAAVSPRLRGFFLANGGGEEAEGGLLAPQELELSGISNPAAVRVVLEYIYATGYKPCEADVEDKLREDVLQLAKAFEVPGLEAFPKKVSPNGLGPEILLNGLRGLREAGLFCDAFLLTAEGGARLGAHQALLAAAVPGFDSYLADELDEISAAGPPKLLEMELGTVSDPIPLQVMLEHVYGRANGGSLDSDVYKPASEENNTEVLRLATSFGLPCLSQWATRWMLEDVCVDNVDERLAACDECNLTTLRDEIASRLPSSPHPSTSDDDEEAQAKRPGPVPRPPATQVSTSTMEKRGMKYGGGEVPELLPDVEEVCNNFFEEDAELLAQLRELFSERPCWLLSSIQHKLQLSMDDVGALEYLLPAVAYQWVDGPWHNAYALLGWDPRQNPDEGKWLQVIDFRDPHFRRQGSVGAAEVHEAEPEFKRAPTQPNQQYQLYDIVDEFVKDVVGDAEPETECDKKTGWLSPFILEVVRDRLCVKSQQLRETAARAALRAEKKEKEERMMARTAAERLAALRLSKAVKRRTSGAAGAGVALKKRRASGGKN